jgi:DNA-binding NarL/FixJ family response regulator
MEVLVIILCGNVHVGLARVAVRQGWTVLALESAVQAMREIRSRCPRLVIVQVSMNSHEPLKLIRLLHNCSQPVLVVAVASGHRTQLERLARDAGANCYLSEADDPEAVLQTVTSMLEYAPAFPVGSLPAVLMADLEPSPPLVRHGSEGVGR